ncbi:MAG: PEP-CTERM sorting domain-containing protein [Terriglobales bacterium]
MKTSQIFAVMMVLAVGSLMAFADPINDPQVIIHGVGGNAPIGCPNNACVDVGLNFKVTIPKSGSGTLFFTNTSGVNWTSLSLVEKGVPAVDIKCHSDLFASCSTETLKNGAVKIFLTTGNGDWPNHGILNGETFAITFACVKQSCWPGGLTVGGHANGSASVPEPGTIALMVTGFGAMFSRRKVWKNRWNS